MEAAGRNPSSLNLKFGKPLHFCNNMRLTKAPIAQLDRVPGFEPGGRRFESFWVRHFLNVKFS